MPFVVRSLERLIDLVDQQMFKIGAQKIQMPSIVGKHLWLRSERWQLSGQEIFRVNDRHQSEYCLAPVCILSSLSIVYFDDFCLFIYLF